MGETKNCYGEMFPDLDRLEHNRTLAGKVFAVRVESKGIGVSGRSITVNDDQWSQCVVCERYSDCYGLSMGKLLLTHVVDSKL